VRKKEKDNPQTTWNSSKNSDGKKINFQQVSKSLIRDRMHKNQQEYKPNMLKQLIHQKRMEIEHQKPQQLNLKSNNKLLSIENNKQLD